MDQHHAGAGAVGEIGEDLGVPGIGIAGEIDRLLGDRTGDDRLDRPGDGVGDRVLDRREGEPAGLGADRADRDRCDRRSGLDEAQGRPCGLGVGGLEADRECRASAPPRRGSSRRRRRSGTKPAKPSRAASAFRPFSRTSGPIPAGSPMVIPIRLRAVTVPNPCRRGARRGSASSPNAPDFDSTVDPSQTPSGMRDKARPGFHSPIGHETGGADRVGEAVQCCRRRRRRPDRAGSMASAIALKADARHSFARRRSARPAWQRRARPGPNASASRSPIRATCIIGPVRTLAQRDHRVRLLGGKARDLFARNRVAGADDGEDGACARGGRSARGPPPRARARPADPHQSIGRSRSGPDAAMPARSLSFSASQMKTPAPAGRSPRGTMRQGRERAARLVADGLADRLPGALPANIIWRPPRVIRRCAGKAGAMTMLANRRLRAQAAISGAGVAAQERVDLLVGDRPVEEAGQQAHDLSGARSGGPVARLAVDREAIARTAARRAPQNVDRPAGAAKTAAVSSAPVRSSAKIATESANPFLPRLGRPDRRTEASFPFLEYSGIYCHRLTQPCQPRSEVEHDDFDGYG